MLLNKKYDTILSSQTKSEMVKIKEFFFQCYSTIDMVPY